MSKCMAHSYHACSYREASLLQLPCLSMGRSLIRVGLFRERKMNGSALPMHNNTIMIVISTGIGCSLERDWGRSYGSLSFMLAPYATIIHVLSNMHCLERHFTNGVSGIDI